jgi:hypothetical protein
MVTEGLVRTPDQNPEGAEVSRRRASRLWGWIIGVLALALFGAAMGYVATSERATNTQFDLAHQSLTATQRSIDGVVTRLDATRHQLTVIDGQVVVDTATLASDSSQLREAKTALANAQAHETNQTSVLADLKKCLGGVEQAENALAVGAQSVAIGALNAVSTSCQGAVAASG